MWEYIITLLYFYFGMFIWDVSFLQNLICLFVLTQPSRPLSPWIHVKMTAATITNMGGEGVRHSSFLSQCDSFFRVSNMTGFLSEYRYVPSPFRDMAVLHVLAPYVEALAQLLKCLGLDLALDTMLRNRGGGGGGSAVPKRPVKYRYLSRIYREFSLFM